MAPAKVTIPPHTAGDTWRGLTFGPITPSPAYTAVSATLTFKSATATGSSAAYAIGTLPANKGVMTISNANTYVILVPRQELPLKAGDYVGRLQIIDSQGSKKSYLDIELSIS